MRRELINVDTADSDPDVGIGFAADQLSDLTVVLTTPSRPEERSARQLGP